MSDWRVMVVEDDRVVAGLHCRFVSHVPGFMMVGAAGTAAQAEQMIDTLKPDLLLLDIGLPDHSGIRLLRSLRARGNSVEVIAVTAATATELVRGMVHLGVVDYLVKPFDQERLRKALALFSRRMAMLNRDELMQPDVDRICSNGPNSSRWLPRDLSIDRLKVIQRNLSASDAPVTAADIAARTGISRVTARRYLEYLVTIGQATSSMLGGGPGRPAKAYQPTLALLGVPR
jgi:response regulator of citrate/malate metabolism